MTAKSSALATTAALSSAERRTRLDELFRQRAALDGEIVVHLGEVERVPVVSRRGCHLDRGVDGRALRCLDCHAPGPTARLGAKAQAIPHLISVAPCR